MNQGKVIRNKIINYSNPELGAESVNTRKVIVYKEGKTYNLSSSKSESNGLNSSATEEERAKWREESLKAYQFDIKNRIIQYAYCNDFDQFWTLTFAEDRYDVEKCYQKLATFLRKIKKKYGNFRYIIVAEFHKDNAVHFHALAGGYQGNLTSSGVFQKGNEVFNLDDWKYGFTNCQNIKNRLAIGAYISKYIIKSIENSPAAKGRKKYWHSDGLKTAQVDFYEPDVSEYLEEKYEPEWTSEDGTKIIYIVPPEEFVDWREKDESLEELYQAMPWYQPNLMDKLKGRVFEKT